MLFLTLSAAFAQDACTECCRAGGLSTCNAELRVLSEGSRVARGPNGWTVSGQWVIGCDGQARYDAEGTVTIDHEPGYGELVMIALNPLQVHCFDQACALPAGTCLSPANDQGAMTLVDCADSLPVDARAMSRPPGSRPGNAALVVVVDGKPLVADLVHAQPYAAHPVSAAGVPPATNPVQTPTPATTFAVPGQSAAVNPGTASTSLDLPADPPAVCKPPGDAMRAEGRRRVDMGDERRMVKDSVGAAREYRAALTMDTCNGYAWLGLGEAAAQLSRPDVAIRALKNATNLLPKHYGAWVLLGKGYEAIGQRTMAGNAYSEALKLSPGLPDAVEGYARTH